MRDRTICYLTTCALVTILFLSAGKKDMPSDRRWSPPWNRQVANDSYRTTRTQGRISYARIVSSGYYSGWDICAMARYGGARVYSGSRFPQPHTTPQAANGLPVSACSEDRITFSGILIRSITHRKSGDVEIGHYSSSAWACRRNQT